MTNRRTSAYSLHVTTPEGDRHRFLDALVRSADYAGVPTLTGSYFTEGGVAVVWRAIGDDDALETTDRILAAYGAANQTGWSLWTGNGVHRREVRPN